MKAATCVCLAATWALGAALPAVAGAQTGEQAGVVTVVESRVVVKPQDGSFARKLSSGSPIEVEFDTSLVRPGTYAGVHR